jgi:hypothetical protein
MRAFSADPRCRAAAALSRGRAASAIEIQRHYLSLAEANLARDFMPEWAEGVCREWRRVLDRLERDPGTLDTTLDWAIKLSVFINRARQRGLAWDSLPHWNRLVTWLKAALAETQFRNLPVTAELVLGESSPLKNEVKALTPYLGDVGLRWDDLSRFISLRRELFETDMRFSQLGRKSVFAVLDTAGLLSHRLRTHGEIRAAIANPPSRGRAQLRGELVRRYTGRKSRYRCDWRGVYDYRRKRVVDLSNPFETKERWRDFSREETESLWGFDLRNLQQFQAAFRRRRSVQHPAGGTGVDSLEDPPF